MTVDNKYLDDTIKTIRARKNKLKDLRNLNPDTFKKLAVLRTELAGFVTMIDMISYEINRRVRNAKKKMVLEEAKIATEENEENPSAK